MEHIGRLVDGQIGRMPEAEPPPRGTESGNGTLALGAERGSTPVGPLRYREVCFATFAQTLRATSASFNVMDGRASVASTTQYS